MAKAVYGIEGIDSVGKDTLIEGIQQALGYYEVIHFSKPRRLKVYENVEIEPAIKTCLSAACLQLRVYQEECFRNSMVLAKSGARLIFNRWHLGEVPYSSLYRGYPGDYVFDLEERFHLDSTGDIRLILLVEDFTVSRHFVSDGQSFDDGKRQEEQELFIKAWHRSIIRDKRIICVTDPDTGGFKPKERILEEALKDYEGNGDFL